MNILAITYCFVPLQYPATFRLLKWFSRLTETGHRITVVAVEPDSFPGPKDPELLSLVPNGVETISAASRENTLLYRFLRRGEGLFYRLFEPRKMEWHAPARGAIRSLRLEEFDLIFSCSQPPVCHLLGREASRRSGLPWAAFFSDPWADNPYRRGQAQKIRDFNLELERSVITSADALILTCQEMKRVVIGKYALDEDDRVSVLPHCFKPDWYEKKRVTPKREGGATEILLTGNFYGPRSPIPLLEILHRLDQRMRLAGRLIFHLCGTMSEADRCSSLWKDVADFVRFHGRVDYLTSLSLMRKADYLLLIDAPAVEGQESVFFPSKLADYLGSGTPVIGLTPKSGASARILRETGHPACDIEDVVAAEEIFGRIAEGTLQVSPRTEEVEKYDYRRVGDKLAAILTRSMERGRR